MGEGRQAPNWVLISLMLAAGAAWLTLDVVSVAPNRIVPGTPHVALGILGGVPAILLVLPMLAVTLLAWHPTRKGLWLSLASVTGVLTLLPLWLAAATAMLVDPDLPQARVGLGSAIWVLLFLLLLALIELRTRLGLSRPMGWLLLIPMLLAWWLSLVLWLEPLALQREYQARSDQFADALLTHLTLVGAAVGASLILASLLALAMRRHPGVRRMGFAALNFLQTIPSLALFGLLLAPLAWLASRFEGLASIGVSGIGWAPAFLALLGYSLLPMVRNIHVALEEVDPAVIESAHGMGMSRRQVFIQVRLPLALPVVLEGVRITTVQAIGLTAVAALIGAGGLGTFIFQGLGQAAMDMVLLGALPIIALALMADALIGFLSERLRPGGLE
ncbi:ABC transporter permease [Billgrantia kenyensis]|uniref:ABC transporter permease n=1 Tax=Billgrantia kenyensis TaxID=321266 RepID=A0A7W0ABU0_9GAMM|nr:ABC transporter permease [Halomonas kenyensis]MBA2777501.1 ABC transporter permease [Halomonas kenyensis]MCG6660171.1 ABC transporter permease [Halomonas kenyensis]